MNQATPIISGKLKWAAVGASLAMLSTTFSLVLSGCNIVDNGRTAIIFGAFFQLIGCIIWGVPLLSCSTPGKNLNIPSSGWKLCAIAVFIGAACQILFLFYLEYDRMYNEYETEDPDLYGIYLFIFFCLYIIIHTLLAFGTSILAKRIKILKLAKVNYIILTVLPVLYFFLELVLSGCSWENRFNTITIFSLACLIIFFISIILLTIAWCCAPSSARRIEHDNVNLNIGIRNQEQNDEVNDPTPPQC